ncbi:hypothetical protein ACOME3_003859 [Neoechinorhynchus agilis]
MSANESSPPRDDLQWRAYKFMFQNLLVKDDVRFQRFCNAIDSFRRLTQVEKSIREYNECFIKALKRCTFLVEFESAMALQLVSILSSVKGYREMARHVMETMRCVLKRTTLPNNEIRHLVVEVLDDVFACKEEQRSQNDDELKNSHVAQNTKLSVFELARAGKVTEVPPCNVDPCPHVVLPEQQQLKYPLVKRLNRSGSYHDVHPCNERGSVHCPQSEIPILSSINHDLVGYSHEPWTSAQPKHSKVRANTEKRSAMDSFYENALTAIESSILSLKYFKAYLAWFIKRFENLEESTAADFILRNDPFTCRQYGHLHRKALFSVYGAKYYLSMKKALLQNPRKATVIIMNRLEERIMEWSKTLSLYKAEWVNRSKDILDRSDPTENAIWDTPIIKYLSIHSVNTKRSRIDMLLRLEKEDDVLAIELPANDSGEGGVQFCGLALIVDIRRTCSLLLSEQWHFVFCLSRHDTFLLYSISSLIA